MKKEFGDDSILTVNEMKDLRPSTRVSTGSIQLDMILGRGGISFGRAAEIYGPQGCGKSTFCLGIIAQAQKLGLTALYVDMEAAIDPLYTEQLGIDGDLMNITHPKDGAKAFDLIQSAINANAYDIIVIDSMALLNPPADLEKKYDENNRRAGRANLITNFFNKNTRTIFENQIMLLCINQLRANMNQATPYSPKDSIPGGYALGHAMSTIIDMRVKERIKDSNGDVIGQLVKVKIKKNKQSVPEKEVDIEYIYGYGVDKYKDLIEVATSIGLIEKGGAWFSFEINGEKQKLQGADSVKKFLVENNAAYEALRANVLGIVGLGWDKEGK